MKFPEISKRSQQYLDQAQARDDSTPTKPCGKDGKAFWFLMGYWSREIDFTLERKKQNIDSVAQDNKT